MASGNSRANEDKKKQVIAKRLEKGGLVLRDGLVVAVCKECGQEVIIPNAPLAAERQGRE
jgi:hypothetical protein